VRWDRFLAHGVGARPDSWNGPRCLACNGILDIVEDPVAVCVPMSGGRRGVVAVASGPLLCRCRALRGFRYRMWLRNVLGSRSCRCGSAGGAVRRCASRARAGRGCTARLAVGSRRSATGASPRSMTSRGSGGRWPRVGGHRPRDGSVMVRAADWLRPRFDKGDPRCGRGSPLFSRICWGWMMRITRPRTQLVVLLCHGWESCR